jgi:hypothetical protein
MHPPTMALLLMSLRVSAMVSRLARSLLQRGYSSNNLLIMKTTKRPLQLLPVPWASHKRFPRSQAHLNKGDLRCSRASLSQLAVEMGSDSELKVRRMEAGSMDPLLILLRNTLRRCLTCRTKTPKTRKASNRPIRCLIVAEESSTFPLMLLTT